MVINESIVYVLYCSIELVIILTVYMFWSSILTSSQPCYRFKNKIKYIGGHVLSYYAIRELTYVYIYSRNLCEKNHWERN